MNSKEKKLAIRINESIRVKEASSCLLCGHEGNPFYQDLRDRLFNAPGIWTFVQCPKCYFVWLNPRPIPEDMGKLYSQYFTHTIDRLVPRFQRMRRFIRDAVLDAHMGYDHLVKSSLKKRVGKVLSWVIPLKQRIELSVMTLHAKKGGRLLEVGCGNGIFLEKMRNLGWEAVGVEMDEKAVEIGRKRFGLDIYKGTLEGVNFPAESMDAIVMHHVIEHVQNPIETLKECFRILKPLGRLVLITPNIESLGHRLFGKTAVHLDPPRHFYLFSPHTLRVCVEKAGLQILELRTLVRMASRTWAISSFIQRNGRLPGGIPKNQGLWLSLESLLFQGTEFLFSIFKNVGEEILLISTKYLDE